MKYISKEQFEEKKNDIIDKIYKIDPDYVDSYTRLNPDPADSMILLEQGDILYADENSIRCGKILSNYDKIPERIYFVSDDLVNYNCHISASEAFYGKAYIVVIEIEIITDQNSCSFPKDAEKTLKMIFKTWASGYGDTSFPFSVGNTEKSNFSFEIGNEVIFPEEILEIRKKVASYFPDFPAES